MSLEPISLALGDDGLKSLKATANISNVDADEDAEKARLAKLAEKLKLHTIVRHSPSHKELALPVILNQINCSFEMMRLLQRNIGMVGKRSKRTMSVSERVVESATTLWDFVALAVWHLLKVWVYPLLTQGLLIALVCHRILAEIILQVLEWRARSDAAALKDISATAQQVDIRLQQFCYWPMQYLTLRKRKDDWESVTTSHPEYIRFYNSLWLVANDVIIGIALGSYIIENASWVAWQIDSVLSGWTIEGLQGMISWLMDWPAGLKLNNELAPFLGDLFLWVIEYWAGKVACANFCRHADLFRLHRKPKAHIAEGHLLHWLFELRRCQHAHRSLLGSALCAHLAHLLLLYCLGPHFQLAVDHHHLFVPPFPRQEAKYTPESDRLVRLRSRSASVGDDTLHFALLLAAYGDSLLSHLCICADGNHIVEGGIGHVPGMLESLSIVRIDVTREGLSAPTWRNSFRIKGYL